MDIRDSKTGRTEWKRAILPALVTFLAFSLIPDIPEIDSSARRAFLLNLIASFRGFSVPQAVQLPCLVLLYAFLESRTGREERREGTVLVPAALFSLFLVFGCSFERDNSWRLVMGLRNGQLLKAALACAGYYIFFKRILRYVYHLADRYVSAGAGSLSPTPAGRYRHWLETRPFRTVFLTLTLVYLPHMIVSYPALFMGDTRAQIVQAFPELGSAGMGYLPASRLLSETVFINQHHPVMHTLLIHVCLLLGRALIGSFNAGIFLCALLQSLGLIAALSCAAAVLLRGRAGGSGSVILLLVYVGVHPLIRNYMCLITKDVLFTAFFVLLSVGLYRLLAERGGRTAALCLAGAAAGMLLFRSEAKYTLPPVFLLAGLIHRPARKSLLLCAAAALALGVAVYGVVFPALRYTPGSLREMLSIPFQQTARYVVCHGDEVTQEEREAIDAVLDYAALSGDYDPDKADPVKNTYREEASREELLRYFRVWAQMLRKHPGTYVQATMNNYYQYFYPGTRFTWYSHNWSKLCMEDTNEAIAPLGQTFSYPERGERIRYAGDELTDRARSFPGLSLLMTPAVYAWLLILMLAYGIRGRKTAALALLMPALAILLVCLAGPINGYYGRYSYPLVVVMLVLIPLFLDLCRREEYRPTGDP